MKTRKTRVEGQQGGIITKNLTYSIASFLVGVTLPVAGVATLVVIGGVDWKLGAVIIALFLLAGLVASSILYFILQIVRPSHNTKTGTFIPTQRFVWIVATLTFISALAGGALSYLETQRTRERLADPAAAAGAADLQKQAIAGIGNAASELAVLLAEFALYCVLIVVVVVMIKRWPRN